MHPASLRGGSSCAGPSFRSLKRDGHSSTSMWLGMIWFFIHHLSISLLLSLLLTARCIQALTIHGLPAQRPPCSSSGILFFLFFLFFSLFFFFCRVRISNSLAPLLCPTASPCSYFNGPRSRLAEGHTARQLRSIWLIRGGHTGFPY